LGACSRGGPNGLFSVIGAKFTTARATAFEMLARIYPKQPRIAGSERTQRPRSLPDLQRLSDPRVVQELKTLIDEEAVVHLDDLLLRRLDYLATPERLHAIGEDVAKALGWSGSRAESERARHGSTLRDMHVLSVS
jgi:glycerol-3-phosphate dehydrogenase